MLASRPEKPPPLVAAVGKLPRADCDKRLPTMPGHAVGHRGINIVWTAAEVTTSTTIPQHLLSIRPTCPLLHQLPRLRSAHRIRLPPKQSRLIAG